MGVRKMWSQRLHAFVRESQERANIFKALYRSGLNDGAAAMNPPRDNRDWLMRMFKDGDRGISASFEDGQAIFRMASGGGSDEIVRITAQGDILADATLVAEGWTGRSIVHISDDGSRAIVCASGNCELVAGACFPAGTPVHTPAGLVPIEKISIGDTIIAYNEIQKDTILSRVTNIFSKSWQKMVRIVAGGDTITATNNHPFYLPQLGKYLRADSLRHNMKLLALTGALLTVHSVAAFDTTLHVYNFEVADHHNYFVGEEGVLVHNDCVFVKLGLRNLPQQTPAHPIFDVFTNVFGTTPQNTLNRMRFLEDYGGLSGQARADFEAFFRADDLLGANPGITHEALLAARGNRARAWGVLRSTGLSTDVSWLTRASKWIDEGAEITEDVGTAATISKNGEELGKIVDGELQPIKYVAGGTRIDDAGSGYDFYRGLDGKLGFRARFIEEYEYGEVVVRLENGLEVGRGSISFSGFFECTIQTVFNERHLAKGENVFDAIYVRASLDGEISGIRGLWNEALPDNLNTFNLLIINEVNLGTMSLEEAALQTFTGKMANQRGFSTVDVIGTPLSDGTYRQVIVEFSN